MLRRADFDHWLKQTYWALDEAAVLLFGFEVVTDPKYRGLYTDPPEKQEIDRLMETARRAERMGDLPVIEPSFPGLSFAKVLPSVFVKWAESNQFPVPPDSPGRGSSGVADADMRDSAEDCQIAARRPRTRPYRLFAVYASLPVHGPAQRSVA